MNDKILHLLAGISIYMTLRAMGLYKVSSMIVVLGIAVGKELYDIHTTGFDFVDILATVTIPYSVMLTEKEVLND